MLNILNSICNEILKVYPQSPIYVEEVKEGFERPSFFVQFVAGDTEIISKDYRQNNGTFQIVVYSEMNKFGVIDKEKQLIMTNKICQVFNKGYFQLEDTKRVVKVARMRSGKVDGEASIDLDLYITENILPEDNKTTPLMGNLKFKLIN